MAQVNEPEKLLKASLALERVPVLAVFHLLLATATVQAETNIDAYYRADFLSNGSGGLDEGSSYLDDAGLRIEMRPESFFGDTDARAFVYVLWNNGATFSDRYTGDLQAVSNIESGKAFRVYELWYEQELADVLSLRFGLYDLNSEFDAIETAGLFLNGSHGMGADFGQSGVAGPSVFPSTSLAARLFWEFTERSSLRYAILDGVPGDPEDPGSTAIDLGGDDGLLHALEYAHFLSGGARIGFGAWHYTSEFELIGSADADAPMRADGNSGFYGFADTPLPAPAGSDYELRAFLRYGIADDRMNALGSYVGAGVVASGLLPSRPDDSLGLAVASGRTGQGLRQAASLGGYRVSAHETALELTYRARITDWMWLQPDLQYVINPGADPQRDNALVFGLRLEFATNREGV